MAELDAAPLVAPNAPVVVAGGTILGTLAGGIVGVTTGILTNRPIPPPMLAVRFAKGWLAFSFGFFAIREYAVRPLLNRSMPQRDGPHTRNLRATFLAGGTMGAVAAAFLRRPVVSGILTIAGLCTGVQLISNEILFAANTLSNYGRAEPPQLVPAPAPTNKAPMATEASSASPEPTSRNAIMRFLERHDIVVPLSDDQYKERLLQRRSEIDRELILLDQELAQERRQLDLLRSTGR
ncbi:hypothetical protein MBRA1_002851 [Malassezia brasiliensis]|uniref:Uncharacterized protein n=1 Tax=Malassezia brasiliensis TaxID=1821822 RepID=A0AAF0IQJ7_9BASI|nr:hypothetical protein MBRA1_002851 [Malassezia brasiliensis]